MGISLNDHDTLDGLEEFMTAPSSREITRVPALEISTQYGEYSPHLHGYFVPENNKLLESKLTWLRHERDVRFSKMLDKVRELGVSPSKKYLEELMQGVMSPGRPHLGRILIDYRIVQDMNEAFDKYLKKGGDIYLPKVKLDIEEAIRLLRKVGAVPVIAHPLDIRAPSIRDCLIEFKEMGILGAEIEYDYTNMGIIEKPNVVVNAAAELGLIGTGGTDYHGGGWRVLIGTVSVSMEVIDQLRDAALELGNDLDSWSN
ncbi:MAG: hypothetical protein P1Q69_08100 [Candidatus Thorarchaeota archaeon]|nr:hypothetical protein [Candidatus Thorarchaeota archaeon]